MYLIYFDEVCERFSLGLMDELWAAWNIQMLADQTMNW